MNEILLGFEVPNGKPFHMPLHHMVITGMTQLSGKTTTIEALIHRSKQRAIVFKTKRGEKGFEMAGAKLPLYFRERSDWQYVSSLIEATMKEKVRFERSWVIRATKGTNNLTEVYNNVKNFLNNKKLRALDRSVFTNLQAYLELILPEIKRLQSTQDLVIQNGVNVMDLEAIYHRPEVQALVIRSVMEHILEHERNIIVVVPECWKFLPQGRNTPVKIFFERFIREGAGIGNYLWLDSQDIAGVDKTPLRQVDNWILGRQREEHEVQRSLDALPMPKNQKPSTLQIRRLKLGHFYGACGNLVKLVYVLPVGISEDIGKSVAMGQMEPEKVRGILKEKQKEKGVEDDMEYKQKYEDLKGVHTEVHGKLVDAEQKITYLENKMETVGKELQTFEDLKEVLQKIVEVPPGHIVTGTNQQIKLEHNKLSVNVVHKEAIMEMTTKKGMGQIMYVAINDLPKEGFTTEQIMKAMTEHGWQIAPSSLRLHLGSNLPKRGLMMKVPGSSPTQYRIPSKIKVKVTKQ